jgi:hypothetical protein
MKNAFPGLPGDTKGARAGRVRLFARVYRSAAKVIGNGVEPLAALRPLPLAAINEPCDPIEGSRRPEPGPRKS